jgi:hypothetical protein
VVSGLGRVESYASIYIYICLCLCLYIYIYQKKPRVCSCGKRSICGENFISRTHELCLLTLLTLLNPLTNPTHAINLLNLLNLLCMHIYIYIYIYTHTYICTPHIHTHTHMYIYSMYMYTCTHTHMYIYRMYMYTCTHTHTHTHTHTQPLKSLPTHTGVMRKRGRINTAYQDRFFVLADGTLQYYSSQRAYTKGLCACVLWVSFTFVVGVQQPARIQQGSVNDNTNSGVHNDLFNMTTTR